MTELEQRFVTQVESSLKNLGAEITSFESKQGRPSWCISISRGGATWPLLLRPRGWNVYELPSIYWRSSFPVWGWPHISAAGDICVSDREGVEYAPDDVAGVLAWLLDEALRMLESNYKLTAHDRNELFADELEGYLQNCGAIAVPMEVMLDPDRTLYAEVELVKKGNMNLVSPAVRRLNHGTLKSEKCLQQRLSILDISIHQLPALNKEWDATWWDLFLNGLTPDQRTVATHPKSRGLLLRVINGYGHALVLLYWGLHPSRKRKTYFVQREDRDYLLRRTGGKSASRHVVVVGCGSIGSRVAEQLTLAGIAKLTLIDSDTFSADNLGRHILGRQAISKLKVNELASFLKDRLPGVEIEPKSSDVQTLLGQNFFLTADAIVLATGNSVVERAIARKAFEEGWRGLLVSTSVEAVGLGGHSIAIKPGTPGCLDCLYMDPDTQLMTASMRTGLIAEGQRVTRQLTGCGAFTPYSSIDATRTALLAAEHVLSNIPSYSRWVGDDTLAKAEGIRPSQAYDSLRAGRIPTNIPPSTFAQPGCPCCGA